MVILSDSLAVVLAGDWNRLFIQPDWIAEHVFENEKIEIGVNGQGTKVSITYRQNGVTILPKQNKMIFSVDKMDDEALNDFCKYLNNFLEKAYTPKLSAYGLNVDFKEDECTSFSEVVDSMSDADSILESGYEIITTKISRVLQKNGKIINVDFDLECANLKVHFNEHYSPGEDSVTFDLDCIKIFVKDCFDLLRSLGYEMEDET